MFWGVSVGSKSKDTEVFLEVMSEGVSRDVLFVCVCERERERGENEGGSKAKEPRRKAREVSKMEAMVFSF
jgi:hypothetical protein